LRPVCGRFEKVAVQGLEIDDKQKGKERNPGRMGQERELGKEWMSGDDWHASWTSEKRG
jgi:hypothetical protein